MFSIFVECEAAQEDLLIAAMWEAGTTGIIEEPGGFRAFFEDGTSIEGLPVSSRREEASTDWAQVSRDAFPPVLVGERFFLVPPWRADPAPEGRYRLVVNPGMACGTGQHPCTRLCLEALERSVRVGDRVLDVGSGSGILSQAAWLLGAGAVILCDIDSGVKADFVGSLDAVAGKSMDVIVANISASAVEDLMEEFQRVAREQSTVIVSGFTEPEIPKEFPAHEVLRFEEWVCLIKKRQPF